MTKNKIVPAWTVHAGSAVAGIALTPGGAIAVGEQGRGRQLTTVPLPSGSETAPAECGGGQTLRRVPVTEPTVVAVLLIRDHSGFRGSWRLAEAPAGRCPEARDFGSWDEARAWAKENRPDGHCAACGVGSYGDYPPLGDQHRLVPNGEIDAESLGRVIASGRCADGHAGNMGGGYEYLIAARPGRFSIRRGGRLYGKPSVITVTVSDDGTVTTEDAWAAVRDRAAQAAW